MSQEKNNQSSQVRYLEPTLYFEKKRILVGVPGEEKKTVVSQFIRKGEVLADFPNYLQFKQRGFLKNPIEAGENVELSQENSALLATASGYPKLNITEQEDGPDIFSISIVPLVKITFNKMVASLVIHPFLKDAPTLKDYDLAELISEAGVVFGIDRSAMARAEQIISAEPDDFEEIPFAKGEYPGEGTDASLQFEIEIGPLAGRRLKDGTIDFRDRRIMVGVHEGDIIATKTPAIAGQAGHNVLGELIESKTGKDLKIKVTGDVSFLPEENKVVATKDGALSVVNKDTIKVAAKTVITGDVDYKTGNIDSENNTIIRGSISPGFKVHVGGDLEIGGGVSSTTVDCGGNAVIRGGITGKSSVITCKGDADIKFIERATITAGGIVVIRNQAYYSTIEANSDIRCHKDSTILGGRIMAGGNLTVGNVGADNCEPAILAAGIDPQRYHQYKELQKQLIEQQEDIIQTLQIVGRGNRPKRIRKMEEIADQLKLQLLKINLIPNTETFSRIGTGTERDDFEEEDPMYNQGVDIENIRIEVYGKIFAGTNIMIGNRSIVLSQDAENRRFRLSKNLKRIMVIPL